MSLTFAYHFLRSAFFSKLPVPTASFEGQTVIVTGANTGLGLETTRYIVGHGAKRVILACRNLDKGKAAAADIRSTTSCSEDTLEVWHLDMCSNASILAFADSVSKEVPHLNTFIANAGVMAATFRMVELDEESVHVNVVGTYLLAFLIYPKLRETAATGAQTRCCILGSDTYEMSKFPERKIAPEGKLFKTLADEKKSDMDDRYATSKLLTLLVGKQMAAIAPLEDRNVIINIMNPSLSQSALGAQPGGIGRGLGVRIFLRIFARSTEMGTRPLIYGASVGPESHGKFVSDCTIFEPTWGLAGGDEGSQLQKRVWTELRQKLEAIRPGVTSI